MVKRNTLHIGVTGSRYAPSREQTKWLKAQFFSLQQLGVPIVIHHGDCLGVDAYAHNLAKKFGFKTHIHPPIKTEWRAFCTGATYTEEPKAYFTRNRDIVDACSQVFALPDWRHWSGTHHTIDYAKETSTNVVVCSRKGVVQ